MKYFTTKYWADWDAGAPVREAYEAYFQSVRNRFPSGLHALSDFGGDVVLQDGTINSYVISIADASVDIEMGCYYDDFNGSQGQRKVTLHYRGVEAISSAIDPDSGGAPPGGYGGYADHGFDEFELIDDGLFEHRMLFDSGIEIGIRFREFTMEYVDTPYVPPPKPEKTPNQLLADAAWRGNADEVRRLAELGANVNGKDEFGDTALVLAVSADNFGMVSGLLDSGADVDAKSDDGSSPLSTAVGYSRPGMVRLLLDRGADPNATDVEGAPILHTAIKDGDFAIIRLLLGGGASPNLPDAAGETALIKALSNPRIVEILLENGADVNGKNSRGETALQIARDKSYHRLIQLLEASGAE